MALRSFLKRHEKVELISLIDMIFILVVFFLITNFVIKMPIQERRLGIPTPKNERGTAQILIQILDRNRVFWLDESDYDFIRQIHLENSYRTAARRRDIILGQLVQRNTYNAIRLNQRYERLREMVKENPNALYFIMIRCPNEVPYQRVVDIITHITEIEEGNLKYGCIGGKIEDILGCREIAPDKIWETDENGRRIQREVIRIDY
jgi:biopolymer transport protein ExbD